MSDKPQEVSVQEERRATVRRELPDRRADIPEKGTLSGLQFTAAELKTMMLGGVVAKDIGGYATQYFGGPNMDPEVLKRLRRPNEIMNAHA